MQVITKLLSACLLCFIAGCKVAVIVVEGGEVQSSNSGTCFAGTTCIVEVNDTDYADTFVAVPDEGWYFEKWNSGDSFWCQNSSDPSCEISSVRAEGKPMFEALLSSSETFYLMPIFREIPPVPESIIVDGREWAQLDLFAGLSLETISTACPAGICTGLLNGYDMTGWTWATLDDFNTLVNFYIGFERLGPGLDWIDPNPASRDRDLVFEYWAEGILLDGMRPTAERDDPIVGTEVCGWLRDCDRYSSCPGLISFRNSWSVSLASTLNGCRGDAGVWFFRAP